MKQKTFMPGLFLSLSLHKCMSVLEKMLARSLSFSLYIVTPYTLYFSVHLAILIY